MELRIDRVEATSGSVLRIAGDLGGPRVAVLLDFCREQTEPLVLSIADLLSADETGLAALRYLRSRGARIVEASSYFSYVLREPDAEAADGDPPARADDARV